MYLKVILEPLDDEAKQLADAHPPLTLKFVGVDTENKNDQWFEKILVEPATFEPWQKFTWAFQALIKNKADFEQFCIQFHAGNIDHPLVDSYYKNMYQMLEFFESHKIGHQYLNTSPMIQEIYQAFARVVTRQIVWLKDLVLFTSDSESFEPEAFYALLAKLVKGNFALKNFLGQDTFLLPLVLQFSALMNEIIVSQFLIVKPKLKNFEFDFFKTGLILIEIFCARLHYAKQQGHIDYVGLRAAKTAWASFFIFFEGISPFVENSVENFLSLANSCLKNPPEILDPRFIELRNFSEKILMILKETPSLTFKSAFNIAKGLVPKEFDMFVVLKNYCHILLNMGPEWKTAFQIEHAAYDVRLEEKILFDRLVREARRCEDEVACKHMEAEAHKLENEQKYREHEKQAGPFKEKHNLRVMDYLLRFKSGLQSKLESHVELKHLITVLEAIIESETKIEKKRHLTYLKAHNAYTGQSGVPDEALLKAVIFALQAHGEVALRKQMAQQTLTGYREKLTMLAGEVLLLQAKVAYFQTCDEKQSSNIFGASLKSNGLFCIQPFNMQVPQTILSGTKIPLVQPMVISQNGKVSKVSVFSAPRYRCFEDKGKLITCDDELGLYCEDALNPTNGLGG